MNIGMVCWPTVGGSGTVACELSTGLARLGHHVHVVVGARPARLADDSGRVRFHEVESPRHPATQTPQTLLALAGRLSDIARRQRLDLLHVHYVMPHAIAGYLAREMLRGECALPLITTAHGTDITEVGRDPAYEATTRFALRVSDGVTAVSDALAARVSEFLPRPAIQTISNFIDVARFRRRHPPPGLRERLALPDEMLLLHVSNFRPVKRINDCIEVFARVARSLSSRLVMVGDGPERAAAEAAAQRLGVAGRVVFTGLRDDVVESIRFEILGDQARQTIAQPATCVVKGNDHRYFRHFGFAYEVELINRGQGLRDTGRRAKKHCNLQQSGQPGADEADVVWAFPTYFFLVLVWEVVISQVPEQEQEQHQDQETWPPEHLSCRTLRRCPRIVRRILLT